MIDPRIYMYPGRDMRDYPTHPTVGPYDIEVVLERRYRNATFRHELLQQVRHVWQQVMTLEQALHYKLSILLHAHPRPAVIHIRRRR